MSQQPSQNFWRNLSILLILFIGIGLGGRFILAKISKGHSLETTSTTTPTSTTIIPERSSNQAVTTKPQPVQESAADTNLASCIASLQSSTTKNHTDYDQGTILVGFKTTTSFDAAKTLLKGLGDSIQNESATQASYSSNHVATVTVPKGKEFEEICLLRANDLVHSASLNVIFNLHE